MVPTMWKGVFEDAVEEERVLPVQFAGGNGRPETPERRLAFSILLGAIDDLRRYRFATRRRHQRLYMEAYRWVASRERDWPFAFERLCDEFGIDAAHAREYMLEPTSTFGRTEAGADASPLDQAA